MYYFKDALSQYSVFSGRTSRKGFWLFFLFFWIFGISIAVVEGLIGSNIFRLIYVLLMIVPFLSITTRRLHDIGRTGWWCLLYLIPTIGTIILLVFFLLPGQQQQNEYG
jgi:uncharacterized membrane protein YhaH (DUF805 family)